MVWYAWVVYGLLWAVVAAVTPLRVCLTATFSLLDAAFAVKPALGWVRLGVWRVRWQNGVAVVNGNRLPRKRKQASKKPKHGAKSPIGWQAVRGVWGRIGWQGDAAVLVGLYRPEYNWLACALLGALKGPHLCVRTYPSRSQTCKGQVRLSVRFTLWDVASGLLRARRRATA